MIAQINMRKGTSAEWAAASPVVLLAGEFGYDTTLKRLKVGDGSAEWASLLWADQLGLEAGSVVYGEIALPNDCPAVLPFTLNRDTDGRIKHDYDLDAFEETPDYTYYVDSVSGNDANAGTSALPFGTMKKAFTEAAAKAAGSKVLIKADGDFRGVDMHPSGVSDISLGVLDDISVAVVPITEGTKPCFSNAAKHSTLTWTADDTSYKCTRTNTLAVFDKKFRDIYGVAKPLTWVADAATCKTTIGSWYTDNATVWVNTIDSRSPDADVMVCIDTAPFMAQLSGTATLYMRDCEFYAGHRGDTYTYKPYGACHIYGAPAADAVFIHRGCIFSGGQLRPDSVQPAFKVSGLAVLNIGKSYGFGSVAAYCSRDGFNYKFDDVSPEDARDYLVFEYECYGYSCGTNPGATLENSNATSAHSGVVTIRVGCVGWNTRGPVLADANGCYSVLHDCRMRDSVATTVGAYDYSSCFYFDNATTGGGKAYLYNCSGGGDGAFTLSADVGFDLNIKNFNSGDSPKYNKVNLIKPTITILD